jgi:hypothetical protein
LRSQVQTVFILENKVIKNKNIFIKLIIPVLEVINKNNQIEFGHLLTNLSVIRGYVS